MPVTVTSVPTIADLRAAAVRLGRHVRPTPVLELHGAELGVAGRVVLKLELTQHTGSFKARGALNALLSQETLPGDGVVGASGGNHGTALAWAAREVGVPATVFVPATSPPSKVDHIRSYGAAVHVVDGWYADALEAAGAWAAGRDVLAVHAYDEPAVVAGQGTLGLELREQVPDADAVLVAVGGGGLVSGVTLACAGGGPRVVPVEPAACPTLHSALTVGKPVDVEVGGIAADSLGARQAGAIAYEVMSAAGEPVRVVEDAHVLAAQAWLWQHCRVLAEAGGAAALAALLCGAYPVPPGDTVVVVVCGGNTDAVPAGPGR